MDTQVRFGQIAWAEVADANGICKVRPVIIITTDDRITPTGSLEIVAITSFLPDPLPAEYVLLPWHAQGHPRTGLNRKSAAVCNWQARITLGDIQDIAGVVPGPQLLEIMSKVAASTPP